MIDRPNELQLLHDWLASGHHAALATVIATWGSAPRPTGSLLVVRDDGVFAGSVSAGCVESAVIEAALQAMADGQLRDLSFGVSDEQSFAVGLACGGTIRIHIEPFATMPEQLPPAVALLAGRRGFVRSFALNVPGWTLRETDSVGEGAGLVASETGERFNHVMQAPHRLFIIGAVHIAQFLSPMATMADYQVTIIDPRTAYATPERFAGATLVAEWPEIALPRLHPDRHTALVTLTHDAKLDDPALDAALRSEMFYIAALGSRRTQGQRRERLVKAGFDGAALDRINGPAGLAIGAASPAEIAISIMAELTAARRSSDTAPYRHT